jgi:hypothetical protein
MLWVLLQVKPLFVWQHSFLADPGGHHNKYIAQHHLCQCHTRVHSAGRLWHRLVLGGVCPGVFE